MPNCEKKTYPKCIKNLKKKNNKTLENRDIVLFYYHPRLERSAIVLYYTIFVVHVSSIYLPDVYRLFVVIAFTKHRTSNTTAQNRKNNSHSRNQYTVFY